MGKYRHSDKEYTKIQKLSHENDKLKREVSKLRKLLARLDLDRYSHIKDVLEQHYKEEKAENSKEILDKIKNSWRCYQCEDGHLEIIAYSKLGVLWYFRQCSHCNNRTKSQKYTQEVSGIKKEGSRPKDD